MELSLLLCKGGKEVDMKDQQLALDKNYQMLTEGRVILPSAQALFGLQLAPVRGWLPD